MKRPLGYACLFFILLIRLFYICFPPSLPDYSSLKGRKVYVRGRVVSIQTSEFNNKSQVLYTLDEVYLQEENISAKDNSDSIYIHDKIRCYSSQQNTQLYIGSQVWIKGIFMPFDTALNPGQFDSRFYFHIHHIGGSIEESSIIWSDFDKNHWRGFLYSLKNYLLEKADIYFQPEYGGVIKTILLGDKTDLDKGLKSLYKESGILHILTISGLHISMIGMSCFKMLRKGGASLKVSAIVGLLLVLLYGALVGTQAATFRAICMFVMQMAAVFLGRTYDRLTGISLAAILLLLEQPLYVFYGGFLLSFGAVLGITIITPIVAKLVQEKSEITKWIAKIFSGSIAILLATFPIQLFFYYEYPLYSVVINILVLPLMPYVVGFSMLVLLIPMRGSIVAYPLANVCEAILYGYECICAQGSRLPYHAVVLGAPKDWQMILYYIGLILFLWRLQKGWRNDLKNNLVTAFISVFFLSGVILLFPRFHKDLSCHFLSVGQGDCTVIRYEEQVYIVDGGSTSNLNAGTEIILPCLKYYGISEVDGIFISHADADHMNGILQWLSEYEHSHVKIHNIILPSLAENQLEEEFKELLAFTDLYNISVVELGEGDRLSLGKLNIQVLHPQKKCSETEDSNGYSQVLLVTYQGQGLLMTGDIGMEEEQEILRRLKAECLNQDNTILAGVQIAALKVPHHGSKYASSEEFLKYFQPQNSIISYGLGNSYGHPHSEVLERLSKINTVVYKTAKSGMVTIRIAKGNVTAAEYR